MSVPTPKLEPQLSPPASANGPITIRSIVAGLFLTVLIAVLSPYSDWVRHNTFLIGNHLPVAVVGVLTLLCVVVNPILGARRLTAAEMTVAIGMMLVACAIPSAGFFRFFHNNLAAPVYLSAGVPWYRDYLALLPDWMLPAKDPNDPVIQNFYNGLPPRHGPSMWSTFGPWARPYLAWAFFVIPFFAAVLFLCVIFRKQWIVHERLAFPLAAIPMEMMAEPELGRRLNTLWRNRLLWIGAAIPFVIHTVNGLALFYKSVPTIPVGYDLTSKLTEYPWNQLLGEIKVSQVYFSVVGVTYFVPLEIAFSLWFFFIAYALGSITLRRAGTEVTEQHWSYQNLGACLAYGGSILFMARNHLVHVARNLFKPREPDEFLPYGVAVFGLLISGFIICGFLWAAGMTWWLTPFIFALLLFWYMIITRVVIEAGVLCVQFPAGFEPMRVLGLAHQGIFNILHVTPDKATWMRNWTVGIFGVRMATFDTREVLMPFGADALRMASATTRPRSRPRFFLLLALAILVALAASGLTHHLLSYTYGRTNFDTNGYAHKMYPTGTMDQTAEWSDPDTKPNKINRGANTLGGALAMMVVAITRMVLPNSPFHPIGLIVLNGWATRKLWFSIFVAWLLKAVILRWGGAKIYQQARPFFIGLLVGESLAGIMWMIVGLWVNWPDSGKPYQLLPA